MLSNDSTSDAVPFLRGHHLVCLQFYDGEGFSDEYVNHLEQIKKRAEMFGVSVCDGADCVCLKCPYIINGECAYYKNAEVYIRRMDQRALELLGLSCGSIARWMDVRVKIEAIFAEWHKSFCLECNWQSACKKNSFYARLAAIM